MLPSAVDSACPEVKESVNLHSFGECFKWHLVIESKIQLPCDKEANDQSSSNSFYITVKSQHSPATFYSCKWSTHQIKANCLSTGWLKDQNPLLLLILNKEQTRTEKKQDGTFCACFRNFFFPFLLSSWSKPERSQDKGFSFVSLSRRYLEMIKHTHTCLFFPFHLESSCQGAQNNASGADGEGRRSRAGKPRFQTRCLCQSCSSAETTSWGGLPRHPPYLHTGPTGPFTLGYS